MEEIPCRTHHQAAHRIKYACCAAKIGCGVVHSMERNHQYATPASALSLCEGTIFSLQTAQVKQWKEVALSIHMHES